MRIVADLSSNKILQVEKSPEVGASRPFNGRYTLPVPEPSSMEVDASSYTVPVDGGDVSSLAMQRVLAQFPMYSHIAFNPLITASDVADLDLAATGPSGIITRCQTGRASGLATGHAPNMTAILPANTKAFPTRPGALVTDTIDISTVTSGAGADEFLVWWKLYQFDTSHDILSDYGATAGQNEPAIKSIIEIDNEPADFEVYLSHDDGANWTQVGRQEPTDMVTFDTRVRLAFVNHSSTKIYLQSYAVLF